MERFHISLLAKIYLSSYVVQENYKMDPQKTNFLFPFFIFDLLAVMEFGFIPNVSLFPRCQISLPSACLTWTGMYLCNISREL